MESWDAVYKDNASKMLGICRRYVKDVQLAEDLVHEAFMAAMNKSDTYSGKGSFEGWLRRIVINTALQHLRKNKNIFSAKDELLEYYSHDTQESNNEQESDRNIIENENFSQQELLETIDELPEHHKAVFNLYVIDEYTHKEIGKMLNISHGTSKSHLARARKKIQQMLFEKAKKKKEEKSRQGFFLFLFAPKADAVDKLFKDKLKSFEIQPKNLKPLKGGSQLVNTQQSFLILKTLMGHKLILISSIGVITVSLVCFLYPQDKPIQQKNKIETQDKKVEQPIIAEPSEKTNTAPANQKDSVSSKKDTILPPLKTKKTINNNKKPDTTIVKKPVVIHKNLVKHDTIVKKAPVGNEK